MKFNLYFMIIVLVFTNLYAQLTPEYQSTYFPYYSTAGWLPFKKNASKWEYRFYFVDSLKFQVYSAPYSGSVQYQYNFAPQEVTAGGKIYSLGIDLTDDDKVEFYVLGQYTFGAYPRQSVRILNVTNNQTLLELNSPNYYYSAPTISDIDNDGILEMTFVEYDILNAWRYRLLVYNTNVSTSILENAPSIGFELKQNYPNPFNPTTNIEFIVPEQSTVKLEIININGEIVKTIINNEVLPGIHKVIWDGTDNFNNKVSSGVYFYRLQQNHNETARKMILLK